jgi:Ca2+-transporting ATPase
MNPNEHHCVPTEDVLASLKTTAQGLSHEEASLRLQQFGHNTLPREKKLSALLLFLRQFENPLIYILFVALVISFAKSHYIDGWIILAVIVLNSVVGFLQEYKANRALEDLHKLIEHKVRVFRDGEETVLNQEHLVPGDVISLSSGDGVPADARILSLKHFEVIEATLTGESEPSVKILNPLPEETPLADRENMVYMGTIVAKGSARAVVTATGLSTELGKVASMLKETVDHRTPIQQQLNNFGKNIAIVLVGINVLIFSIGVIVGRPFFEMFLASVAATVAAIPEGLLTAMVIVLTVGMQRLAKRKGLVRKMIAAETLGSVSVICADKTGTLTEGEMRVVDIITDFTTASQSAVPFPHTQPHALHPTQALALKIGVLNNDAVIDSRDKDSDEWNIIGSPTEKALIIRGHKDNLVRSELERSEPRIAEIPFDSEHKFMATLHVSGEARVAYVKGAPERILQMSTRILDCECLETLDDSKRENIQNAYANLASRGLRAIAVAYKPDVSAEHDNNFTQAALGELVFVGLIAMKDPPREEVKEALELVRDAGIKTIVITGDHKLTARAIVSELGIVVDDKNIMEGFEIDRISKEKLRERVKDVIIFARVEPRHKVQVIEALQANGEVVAMTGDGVNDAPALKKADIGIAVGSGTHVTRNVADLVLLDDSFKTIVEAIKGGRVIFNNIRRVLLFLLGFSFSGMFVIAGSVLAVLPLSILPAQMLWINLIQTAPAMALAFGGTASPRVMKEKPRRKNEPLLNDAIKKRLFFYVLIVNSALFGLFYYILTTSGDVDYARTMVFAGLAIMSVLYTYNVHALNRSIFQARPWLNKNLFFAALGGVVTMFIALYAPFFSDVLQTTPLSFSDWMILIGYALFGTLVYEVVKKFTPIKHS